MIGYLRGRLLKATPERLLVEAGGVGYSVAVSLVTFSELERRGGEVVELHVHTHVREDQLALYGFASERERELFERLITVSGIGPRLAQVVLSGLPTADLLQAIASGDVTRLTRIPGVGKKTAERMVVELRDRAADFAGGAPSAIGVAAPADAQSEAVIALQQLGYKPAEAARRAREAVAAGDDAAAIIRKALKSALR